MHAAQKPALLLGGVLLLALTSPALGHVVLDAPNGGEVLQVGSVFTITWHIQIAHTLQNWDLWYSTNSPAGPWVSIAMDLPPGNPAVGSVHTYDWTVPAAAVSDEAWIRVRMDNAGTDYEDVNNAPFAVEGSGPSLIRGDCNGDENIDIADPVATLAYLFQMGNLSCLEAADTNDDGSLDVADTVYLLAWLFAPGSPPPPPPFPGCGEDPLPEAVGCETSTCVP